MNRLESSAPALASRLQGAEQQSQRSVAVAAASWAAGVAHLDQASVINAIDLLRQGFHERVARNDLAELVEELDDVAWLVQDAVEAGSASSADYLTAFGRARAAAAVLFAAEPDSEVAALEATYEASVVLADNSALFAAVEAALGRP